MNTTLKKINNIHDVNMPIAKVADSLNQLYAGVEVNVNGMVKTIRAMVTQYRGDWKFHRATC